MIRFSFIGYYIFTQDGWEFYGPRQPTADDLRWWGSRFGHYDGSEFKEMTGGAMK